jgi:hypothetical protein
LKYINFIGGATLASLLTTQNSMLNDNAQLASSLARIYGEDSTKEWPKTKSEMKLSAASNAYKQSCALIHDVLRSSTSLACSERGIEPLRAAVLKFEPDIAGFCKERELALIDFDSYKRRLAGFEKKRDDLEADGKGNTEIAIANLEEVSRWEMKTSIAKDKYEAANIKAKDEMIDSKRANDQLMDLLMITVVTTQAELFTRAAEQLNTILDVLPQDKVSQVKKRIELLVQGGGVAPVGGVPTDLNNVDKALAIATGKYTKEEISLAEGRNNVPFHANSLSSHPPPPPSSAKKPHIVVALYDVVADEPDELEFKVGDKVEVLETMDGGWWKGKCNGKEGLFPVSYVDVKL